MIERMFDKHSARRPPSFDAASDESAEAPFQGADTAPGDVDRMADAANAAGDGADAAGDGADAAADGADAAGDGADDEAGSSVVSNLVARVRANAVVMAAGEARALRLVAELAEVLAGEAVAKLAASPRVPGAPQDREVIDSAVVGEVQVVLGIAPGPAARLVDLARRLTSVMPEVLVGLESGRLDLTRARALAEATEVLPDDLARVVVEQLMGVAGEAPWEGLSPRAWRARTDRAVVRVDAEAAHRRRQQAYAARAVRSVPGVVGMAELFITADAADVAMAEAVWTDLAQARPSVGPDGGYMSMDARRVDSWICSAGSGTGRCYRGRRCAGSGSWGWCCTRTRSSVMARPQTIRGRSAALVSPSSWIRTPPASRLTRWSTRSPAHLAARSGVPVRSTCCWSTTRGPCRGWSGCPAHRPVGGLVSWSLLR
jgi:Domain of unknown function (DUF222)